MNRNLNLVICGHGALAQAFTNHRTTALPVISFDNVSSFTDAQWEPPTVGIHVGKFGKQLPEFIKFCQENNMPLIQAATGMHIPEELQNQLKIPLIDAPNMAIEIIAFLKHLPAFVDGITKQNGVEVTHVSLLESHQESKGNSVPGTARKIGSIIGVPDEQIVSIRDPIVQQALGIPPANLKRHAYHSAQIQFKGGTRIVLQTKIHDLETYVHGGTFLAQRAIELNLPPGLHSMTELI